MKILYVSACPPAAEPLDIEGELATIRVQVQRAAFRDQISFVDQGALTSQALIEQLSLHRPDVLHFSGHGIPGGLILRGKTGEPQALYGDSLLRILTGRSLRLLVLNACYSDELGSSLLRAVPAVVGTTDAVRDRDALLFSGLFYKSLGDGAVLQDAFDNACNEIHAQSGNPEQFRLVGEVGLAFCGPGAARVPATAADELPADEAPAGTGKWWPPYRSRLSDRGQPGISHELGSIHLHVDGPQTSDLRLKLLTAYQEEGFETEYSHICDFVPGPQRTVESRLYQFHTPGNDAREELDFFSTTVLHHGPGLPNALQWSKIKGATRDALVYLYEAGLAGGGGKGVVVELERVAGVVDREGLAVVASPPENDRDGRAQLFARGDLFFKQNVPACGMYDETWYELHFSLDFPKRGEQPPISLAELSALTQRAGLTVGGWFIFQDTERWAYRSNAFTATIDKDALHAAWERMNAALAGSDAVPRDYGLRLLAEESLAVWKSPLEKIDGGLHTVPDLARWESGIAGLDEFWVVTPQFLGDTDEGVHMAMQHNLRRGVHYVYFLRSNADARRWHKFKRELAAELSKPPWMDAYVLEFDDNFWEGNLAFVANPLPRHPSRCSGMRLGIDRRTRRVVSGHEMEAGQLGALCDRIEGTIRQSRMRRWEHVADEPQHGRIATLFVACLQPLGAVEAECFDGLLAENVSINQGDIVEYQGTRAKIAFPAERGNVIAALRCAADMVEDIGRKGNLPMPMFGIDAGWADLVLRACGLAWRGDPVAGCGEVAQRFAGMAGGRIYLTDAAAEALKVDSKVWPDLRIERAGEGAWVATVAAAGATRKRTRRSPAKAGRPRAPAGEAR